MKSVKILVELEGIGEDETTIISNMLLLCKMFTQGKMSSGATEILSFTPKAIIKDSKEIPIPSDLVEEFEVSQ